jgi:hypothetical protein
MSMQAKGLATEDTEITEEAKARSRTPAFPVLVFSVHSASSVAKRFCL